MPPANPFAARFQAVLDLHDTGVEMMRMNLRRRHPDATDAQIQQKLVEWLHDRPGAPDGDGEGRRVSWPREGR